MDDMQLEDMRRQLREHDSFHECILQDVQWLDQGTTIALIMDCTWGAANRLHAVTETTPTIRLVFTSVQEFHVSNALSQSMLEHMPELNWGLSEIAAIRVDCASTYTSRYEDLPSRFFHAAVLWEGPRRIDIVFGQMTIDPSMVPPADRRM